jgi:hypothetical protein
MKYPGKDLWKESPPFRQSLTAALTGYRPLAFKDSLVVKYVKVALSYSNFLSCSVLNYTHIHELQQQDKQLLAPQANNLDN